MGILFLGTCSYRTGDASTYLLFIMGGANTGNGSNASEEVMAEESLAQGGSTARGIRGGGT